MMRKCDSKKKLCNKFRRKNNCECNNFNVKVRGGDNLTQVTNNLLNTINLSSTGSVTSRLTDQAIDINPIPSPEQVGCFIGNYNLSSGNRRTDVICRDYIRIVTYDLILSLLTAVTTPIVIRGEVYQQQAIGLDPFNPDFEDSLFIEQSTKEFEATLVFPYRISEYINSQFTKQNNFEMYVALTLITEVLFNIEVAVRAVERS